MSRNNVYFSPTEQIYTFIFKSNVDTVQLSSDSDESEELFIFNICSISKLSPDISIDVRGVTWLDGIEVQTY